MMLSMYDLKLDWSAADVTVEGHSGSEHLVLNVSLDSQPDTYWRNHFGRMAERRSSEAHGLRWTVTSPNNVGRLSARGFDEVGVDVVREALDSMVAQANQEAWKDRQTVEDEVRGEHQRAAKLEQDAQSLTEHFRQK
jgi:hypothetical protein